MATADCKHPLAAWRGVAKLAWLLLPTALLAVACQAEGTNQSPTGAPAVLIPSPTPFPTATSTQQATAVPEATTIPEATAMPEATSTEGPKSEADADVIYVRAVQSADGSWTFHVTVSHPDTGWEDYADGWDVVTPDGVILKSNPDDPFTRLLLHPHETEQPVTRSQSGIVVPDGIDQVTVRAHDILDGFGGQEITVDLTIAEGRGFQVDRG